MGYVDKSDRMVNSYGIAKRTWKWTKKLFFHLLDMTILNVLLLHKTCGNKMTQKIFREVLVHNLITELHELRKMAYASECVSGWRQRHQGRNKSVNWQNAGILSAKKQCRRVYCMYVYFVNSVKENITHHLLKKDHICKKIGYNFMHDN